MIDYLKENVIFVLLIAGALVPFVLSLYEKVAEKKRLRVVLLLVSAGFIITLCTIIISHIQKRTSERINAQLDAKKTEMINEISTNVSKNLGVSEQSLNILERLQKRLSGTAFGEVAVKLATLQYDKMHAFEKGSVEKLDEYVSWLGSLRSYDRVQPALSLTLNAGKNYYVGLIIAYLIANDGNLSTIQAVLREDPSAWEKFPDETMMNILGDTTASVKYVLFYDRVVGNLVGYADASLFLKELLLYREQQKQKDIQNLLQASNGVNRDRMRKTFSSYLPHVFRVDDAYNAARIMIEERVGEGVALHQDTPWFINLAGIIKLVS